ncbi:hypothetical protein WJ24_03635 [Burkholderia vietnamiensis]|uniref:hypothetical protein n=1 Tax=Burkholderia vietnamiensis TaxID=60552 RepID=UPI00075C7182|nr:hypothetical protein [Burkholderia vietnamiensis]KVG13446.1 hypothetical protein WJ24_03635 [Burkholderia vietnamiensis]
MSENTKIEVPRTTLAYLAGTIDGDGYVTITHSTRRGREYFAPQIGMSGTMRAPHDLAASIWGGSVYRYLPANANHRPQFQWQRQSAAAMQVIAAVFPYLLLKQEQALLAMELWQTVEEAKTDDPLQWFSSAYDPLSEMQRMRAEMIELHQSRVRSRKYAGRHLDGRTHDEFPEHR